MRKLFESVKLSSKFDDIVVSIKSCDLLPSKEYVREKAFRADQIYDVNNRISTSLNFIRTLNLIIHSAIFCEVLFDEDDERIEGFFVNSDLNNSKIYFISINRYTELMRKVGNDNVTSIYRRNISNGEIMEWRGNGEIPAHILSKFETVASGSNK